MGDAVLSADAVLSTDDVLRADAGLGADAVLSADAGLSVDASLRGNASLWYLAPELQAQVFLPVSQTYRGSRTAGEYCSIIKD